MQSLQYIGHDTRFYDRYDAGQKLAQPLARYAHEHPLILALPRGGVPVGYEIAHALKAPLGVFLVRKLGAPGHAELGIGAVAQGGLKVLNQEIIHYLGVSPEYLSMIEQKELREIESRLARYHLENKPPDITGKTVILVDDGLATGVTAKAALEALKQLRPKKLILAVPVGSMEGLSLLKPLVDEVVCLQIPADFMAVGLWYQHFDQTEDQEVLTLLEKNRQERNVWEKKENAS